MADKYFEDQFEDEEVLYVFRKHPVVMRKGLILAMIGPLLGILPATFRPELGFGWFFGGLAAGIILGVLFFLPSWISWYFSVFIITNQRLIQVTQKGLFNRSVIDMGLNQIQLVNYQVAGLQETLLGFGTIMMQTLVGDLVIHDIHHPGHIQKKILQILRDNGFSAVDAPQQATTENQEEYEKD
jgi:signal transduction histidine kinase